MVDKRRGDFSRSLFSLQLQIKTLLEEAGGDPAISLLDSLCKLNKSEQKIALGIFNRCIERISSGDTRLCTQQDKELKDFEDGLYRDILESIGNAALPIEKTHKFEVLDGGKLKAKSETLIDLDEARAKRTGTKPFVN